jgi:hypothetical protein
LPIGIVRPALDVVNRLSVQFKRDAQLDQRLDLPLSRDDSFLLCGN